MSRHPTRGAHEEIEEIPTVLIYCLGNPQPRERTGLGKSAGKGDPVEIDSRPTL
ncbi:unnamed protein product [Sphacelaria rigidula]